VTEHPLPEPVARRGLTEAQWRTLKNNLFPGAASDSVLMVVDYCRARKLDPLKKPCHIVPMSVKNAQTGAYEWRDVVMPGIYEYRTTAMRTGLYLGHSAPVYGPEIDFKGIKAPESVSMTFYRWNKEAGQRIEFPVTVLFREAVATKKDGTPTERWFKAPVQMLTKCGEAAGLREAFPDEFGGEATFEEMEGRTLVDAPAPAPAGPAPRDATEKVGAIKDRLKAKTSASAPASAPAEAAAPPVAAPIASAGPNEDGELTPEQLDLRRQLDAEGDEIPY